MTDSPAINDKRLVILNATLSLLATRGFHGFSIKQLATKAGVAAGTIYLYFEDREALISELHSQILANIATAVFTDDDESLDIKTRYYQISKSVWQYCVKNPEIILSKMQFDHLPPDVLRSQHEAAWAIFKPISNLFEKGRQSGLIKNLSDDVLSSLCFEPQSRLSREHALGLIQIDDDSLNNIIEATWHAISTHPIKNILSDSESSHDPSS